MEELLDMLDSSIFTDEIKDKIKEEFDKAVQVGVELELAKTNDNDDEDEDKDKDEDNEDNEDNEGDEDKEPEYEGDEAVLNTMTKKEIVEKAEKFLNSEISKLMKKADDYAKYISEKYTKAGEAYGKSIAESYEDKANKYGKYVEKQLTESFNKYMDSIADTIVESYEKENVELKTKIAKAETLVEGFESMLKTGGVYLKDIIIESEKHQLKNNRPDIQQELNNQISENVELKSKVLRLEKEKIINESTKDLTSSQKESVSKLSGHIKTNDIEKFSKELKSICEGVVSGTLSGNTITSPIKKDINNLVNENITRNKKKIDSSVSHTRFF